MGEVRQRQEGGVFLHGESATYPPYHVRCTKRRLPAYSDDCGQPVQRKAAGLDYTVTPKVLAFGTAAPGEVLGAFVVEGEGISITQAQADNAGLVLEVSEVEAGKQYRVEAIAGKNAAAGRLLSTVTLRIGDGTLSEEVKVRVCFEIRQLTIRIARTWRSS